MKLKEIIKNDICLITLLYFLAHGLILFNDGIFLDDWVFYHVDKANCIRAMSEVGHPWLGYFYSALFLFNNILLFRVLTFCSYLLTAFLLYAILKDIKEILNNERLFIVLIFALFPVNFARIAAFTLTYTLGYLFFFFGLFILSRYLVRRNPLLRISALLFLFSSFFALSSLLVFYCLVFLYILYAERVNISIKKFFIICLKYLDFLMAPFIFWAIKNIFFKPYGLGAGYNEITLSKLLSTRYNLTGAFYNGFIYILQDAFRFFASHPLLIIVASLILSILIYKRASYERDEENNREFFLLLLGVIAFLSGVYAYIAIGGMTTSCDWWSRNQILIPLGASFIIFYTLKIFLNYKARTFVSSLLIVIFVYVNFLGYLEYQKDQFKQLSLMENMRLSKVIRDNTTFLFEDNAKDLWARQRQIRYYELNGMMKYVFGDETRLGVMSESFTGMDYFKDYIPCRENNMGSYKLKNPEYEVIIKHGTYKLDRTGVVKLYLERIFKSGQYKENIKRILVLEYMKI